jgi:hypothetical protein
MQKPPFTYFGELSSAGVKTMWANPNDLATLPGQPEFDVVVDNNGKDMDTVGPVADFAVKAGAKQFFFVSSAGMYIPTVTPPHLEGDAVKESAGHAKVEAHLKTMPFKMSSFRPQYFTGYGNNKGAFYISYHTGPHTTAFAMCTPILKDRTLPARGRFYPHIPCFF